MYFLFYPLRNYLCSLLQTLTIYRFSEVFAYGFHSLPTKLQKVSFYSVKGRLLKDKKPCITA